jgi:hypothetical protein
MLLSDCGKRSEQLPTTHNNQRLLFPIWHIAEGRASLFTTSVFGLAKGYNAKKALLLPP